SPRRSRDLPFSRVIDPEAPPVRPQRHIPNSISTVRRRLIIALARTALSRKLGRDPAVSDRMSAWPPSATAAIPFRPSSSSTGLALSPLYPGLPRRRGTPGRTRARHLLRNRAAVGAKVRSCDCATAAPASSSAQRSLALGRDGGAHRRRADVSVACRG